MRRFWYFDVSLWSVDKKSCLSKLSNKCVFTPYCKDWEPIYPLNTFVRLRFPWILLRFPQTPPNIPLITPWHLCGTWHANRRQQTLPKTPRNWQVLFEKVWQCFLASFVVCWHFIFPGDIWGCLGGPWGVSGGIWVVFMEIGGAWISLGGYMGSQSLQYGGKTLFWHSPDRYGFCQLTILRHQNTKTAAYKLSKNDWVMPFFVIFRFAREKLLVTVSWDHPIKSRCPSVRF